MLVLNTNNNYMFANTVITLTDNTVITDEITTRTSAPAFNVLIPIVHAVGPTNALELYHPGEVAGYTRAHGKPNPLKFGFGPDFIHGILSRGTSGAGVYTVNLRGASATNANVVVAMKYRVEHDVPYLDEAGDQYYVDQNGQLTTNATDAEPVVRDVLHVKFVNSTVENCKKWTDIHSAMNSMATDVLDDEGYATLPVFAVMYRGASTFGNDVYFNMVPKTMEYDGNTYYSITMFDGTSTSTTDYMFAIHRDAGMKYQTTYFIETLFNNAFPTMRCMASESIDSVYDVIGQYLYSVDDYLNGTMKAPSKDFMEIDMFNCGGFGIVVDEGSINSQIANAFSLSGGYDGDETADELFEMFFRGEIIEDLTNPLRYRLHYIPDTGYNDETKHAIRDLIHKRERLTNATFMVGGYDTFGSALIDHQAQWYENEPNIRQIPKCQSAMRYNDFIRRTIRYPASYFDTMALMDHFALWNNFYQPFAGADARWTGYVEDTMQYPAMNEQFVNSLYKSRINCVMKDAEDGAYLCDQQMNTVLTSDQTELNNAFLISNMLYDLLWIIHKGHFKFNESEHVRLFQQDIHDCINNKYAQYSASISAEVYRLGTVGRAKSANKIKVSIDMRDINKFADLELVLNDA